MGRLPCCDKNNVNKGPWTAEEDAKLLECIARHGTGNWTSLPTKAGLKRCGKSCRLRWTNYLRPDLKHDHFTSQEEQLIVNLHAAIGSRFVSEKTVSHIAVNFHVNPRDSRLLAFSYVIYRAMHNELRVSPDTGRRFPLPISQKNRRMSI